MGRPPKNQTETTPSKPTPVKKTAAAAKLTAVKPVAPAPAPAPTPAKPTLLQRVKKFFSFK